MTGAGVKPDGSFIVWTCPALLRLRGSKTLKTFIYEIKKAKQNLNSKQRKIFFYLQNDQKIRNMHTHVHQYLCTSLAHLHR